MENLENKDMIDLGSVPIGDDFDPFAEEDAAESEATDTTEDTPEFETQAESTEETQAEDPAPELPKLEAPAKAPATTAKDTNADDALSDKPPVFEYAGATENIDDTAKTFDELRIEKATDFPELDDGKKVSWTVEYGKITKTVADPKGMSIGKMKSDIEASKEFADALKKRGADKNPACKIKPRVTAQSKGQAVVASSYRGVFTNMDDAEAAGKVISIIPAKDGKVYEIRRAEMGKFITPVVGCDLLSDVRAGFNPALPRVPMELIFKVISFFRYYMNLGAEKEALVNIYWDKVNPGYFVDVPKQVVTKASVESQINDDYTDDRYIHFMDIHSHNSMKAFFSPTDNADEKATRLYTVIGNLHEYFPDIKTRISNGGKFLDIDPLEVFEFEDCSFPVKWTENVQFRKQHNDYVGGEDSL